MVELNSTPPPVVKRAQTLRAIREDVRETLLQVRMLRHGSIRSWAFGRLNEGKWFAEWMGHNCGHKHRSYEAAEGCLRRVAERQP